MSFLQSHSKIEIQRLIPSWRSASQSGNFITNTIFTITPATPPIAGNLMWISIGGQGNRAVTGGPSGGWVAYPADPGMGALVTGANWFKIATDSEPASWTATFSASLPGGWTFSEFENVETAQPYSTNGASTGGIQATTLVMPNYQIICPGISLAAIYKGSSLTGWAADNGYSTYGGSGQHRRAFKAFSYPILENFSWSGGLENAEAQYFLFKGTPIF